jgi:hypothetical protein
MKKLSILILAGAFVFGSGFFKKGEDGSYSVDTSGIEKKASDAAAAASTKADDLSKQAEEISAKAIEKIKTEAAKINVLSNTKTKMADYTQQAKNLNFFQKFSTKGKELKAQAEKYTSQFDGLKNQCSVYTEKLTALGITPAALGIDLSEYGL